MKDFNRSMYQELLNKYVQEHEQQIIIDFHHQINGAF